MVFSQRNYASCVGIILMVIFSCCVFALNYKTLSQDTFREVFMHSVLGFFSLTCQELLCCYEDTIHLSKKEKSSLICDLWFRSSTKPDDFYYSQTQVWYTETKSVWSQVQALGMREILLYVCSQRRKACHVQTLLCWSYGRFSLIRTTLNSSSTKLCQNK